MSSFFPFSVTEFFLDRLYKSDLWKKIAGDDSNALLAVPRTEPLTFPAQYIFVYWLAMISLIGVFMVGGMFALIHLFSALQEWILAGEDGVLFNETALLIVTLPSLFVGLTIGGICLKLTAHLVSPAFESFLAFKYLTQSKLLGIYGTDRHAAELEMLKQYDPQILAENEWAPFRNIALVVFLPAMLIYFLAFDTFTLVNKTGIYTSAFLSLGSEMIDWSTVDELSAGMEVVRQKVDGKYTESLKPKLAISAAGSEVILWSHLGLGTPAVEKLITVAQEAVEHDVKISATQLTEEQKYILSESYSPKAVETAGTFFAYLDSIAIKDQSTDMPLLQRDGRKILLIDNAHKYFLDVSGLPEIELQDQDTDTIYEFEMYSRSGQLKTSVARFGLSEPRPNYDGLSLRQFAMQHYAYAPGERLQGAWGLLTTSQIEDTLVGNLYPAIRWTEESTENQGFFFQKYLFDLEGKIVLVRLTAWEKSIFDQNRAVLENILGSFKKLE